jgi:phosphatidylglycerophosphatase C
MTTDDQARPGGATAPAAPTAPAGGNGDGEIDPDEDARIAEKARIAAEARVVGGALESLSTAEAPPGPDVEVAESATPGESSTTRPGVAAFDFDGTLAREDTFVPFLRYACGNRRTALAAAAAARTTRDRDALKLAVLTTLFRGWSQARFDELGASYALRLPSLLRPTMLDRLRWHQAEGHQVVIVSASLGTYLRPLAQGLGIDEALGVELVATGGTLTGEVIGGANCRGAGKVTRLRAWAHGAHGPGTDIELWAYGDSSGDEELLTAADHPTWVGRRAARNGNPADTSRLRLPFRVPGR